MINIGLLTFKEFVDEDVGNVTARPNDSVILKCTFNQSNGTCIWKRNGKVLKIGDRISWVSRDSSRNAMTHCSIKVKEVQHTDFGMYECIIFKTSSGENENDTDNQAIYSKIVWIS